MPIGPSRFWSHQLTLIGWISAAIWAVYSRSYYKTHQEFKKSLLSRVDGT